MIKDEVFSQMVLSIIVALNDDMSNIGIKLPTLEKDELLLIGLATAADRTSVVMAKEIADYITEAVIRRASEVGLIVDIDEEKLTQHQADGRVDLSPIRDMLDEYGDPEKAFVEVRRKMIDGWPLLEKIREGERGKGPRIEYELMRLNRKPIEEQN